MSWFRRGSNAVAAQSLASPASPASGAAPASSAPAPLLTAQHPAPGLKSALDALPRPGALVLDLGPALAANIAFFCSLGARLRIVDLVTDLAEMSSSGPDSFKKMLPMALPLAPEEKFDLVLTWDLANYVGRERWPTLAAHLTAHLAERGAVHLLSRIVAEMPALPCRYRITEPGTLEEELVTDATVPAPRFSHAEIEKLHPGWVAPRSFLGRHGVQEFLLEPASAHNLPPRAVAKPRVRTRPTAR